MTNKSETINVLRERLREIEQPTVCGSFITCTIISGIIHIKIRKALVGIVAHHETGYYGALYDHNYGTTINCTTATAAEIVQRVTAFLSTVIAPENTWSDTDFDI